MFVAMLAGAQGRAANEAPKGAAATLPQLMQLAKQMIAERQGDAAEIDRQFQQQEPDSYLAALEYSHNSAALQGEEGGFVGFFR